MPAILRRLTACIILLAFVATLICQDGQHTPWEPLWWVERAQFVPAILGTLSGKAWAGIILGVLLLLTLVFGRVYCSWLCPLGILQDAANRAVRPRPLKRQGKSVRYAPNRPWLRAFFALLGFALLVAGSVGLLTWLDPYSIAARGMYALVNLLQNWLGLPADLQPSGISYCAAPVMALAAFGLALPLALAVWRGRLYCNSICPVGAILGLIARISPCSPHIDPKACGRCGACMKSCKAQAIDLKNMRIDATRCVGCYNCLAQCQRGAINLRPHSPAKARSATKTTTAPVNAGRRAFLGLSYASIAAAAWPRMPQPALSTNPAEQGNNSAPGAVPPGAKSVEHLLSHCTACGLCIANCPTQVLRPSLLVHGLRGFMKPGLDYTRGYCDPNCTTCSHACPTGALHPLQLAEKRRTQIGLVHYEQAHCLVWKHRETCARCVTEATCPTGALAAQQVTVPAVEAEQCRGCRRCLRVCPVGAISMAPHPGKEKNVAVIDRSKCIGCGACSFACRPKAIDLRPLVVPRLAHPEKCIGCGACEHACPTERAQALCVIAREQHLTTPEN